MTVCIQQKIASFNPKKMKSIYQVLCTIVFFALITPAFAQKYRTTADTGRLNAEYVKVQNKIADLTAQLSEAQSNLPNYQTKALNAGNTAQTAVQTSDASAGKATSGNMGDVKDAKNEANNAYDKAKDAQNANKDVSKLNDKIMDLNHKLAKQRQRLKDLDQYRSVIYSQLPK